MHEIRNISEADIPAWEEMQEALYGPAENETIAHFDLDRKLNANGDEAFLVFKNGVAVGFLEMALRNLVDGCATSPVAYIEGLYVKPNARGRGFGVALVEHAHEWARAHHCTEIATDSLLEDVTAQQFHSAMGFEETYRVVQFRKSLD